MAAEYVKSLEGFHFEVDEAGKDINYVKGKYDKESKSYNQYQHCVPKSWVDKKYVKMVKDEQ